MVSVVVPTGPLAAPMAPLLTTTLGAGADGAGQSQD